MRQRLVLGIIVGLLISAGNLYANIDNLSNMSAEWIRTGNRNAATDAADIVVYNPGGITQLPDGFMVNIGNQTLIRKPNHSYDLSPQKSALGLSGGAESHEQDDTDWFLPNVYMTYNKDNWALFGGYYIPGGGAVVDYPNGSVTTDMIGLQIEEAIATTYSLAPVGYTNEYLEAESVYNTLTFGVAYQFNDMVSAAYGIRYVMVKNNIKAGLNELTLPLGDLQVDVDEEGDGVGFIAGVNINITPKMNLGIQYMTKVGLDLKTSVNRDDLAGLGASPFTDGEKNPRDLPGMLGLGLGYDISDKLYAEVNYSHWFQKNAEWDVDDAGRDISDMAGDAQSFGITAAYKFTPTLLASVGTTYTDFRWNDIEGYYEANIGSYEVLYTDNWHLGCGAAWTVVDNVTLNLSLAQTIWDDKDLTHSQLAGVTIATENSTTIVAMGVNVAF